MVNQLSHSILLPAHGGIRFDLAALERLMTFSIIPGIKEGDTLGFGI